MANPEALGQLAYTCSWIESQQHESTIAVCHGLLNINTQWHKKDDSAAAFSFLVDTDAFSTNDLRQLTPLAAVVTGTTGAWPKPESVEGFYLDVVVSDGGLGGLGVSSGMLCERMISELTLCYCVFDRATPSTAAATTPLSLQSTISTAAGTPPLKIAGSGGHKMAPRCGAIACMCDLM